MPISRRGLTAAGLALAAVATVGVTSTLNASAAQVARPRLPAMPAPATSTDTPPPPLPGDGKPSAGAANMGKVAASSARQADAALVDTPPPVDAVHVAKGLPLLADPRTAKGATSLRSREEATTSTATAFSAAASPPVEVPSNSVKYFHALGEQVMKDADGKEVTSGGTRVMSDGTVARLTVAQPKLGPRDLHSIGQIAVRSFDGHSTVEVGWIVSRQLYPNDLRPHLFVYHWVDGVPQGYNNKFKLHPELPKVPDAEPKVPGAEPEALNKPFVPEDKPVLGQVLAPGTHRFGIQNRKGDWWISLNDTWIGYFPKSNWPKGNFVKTDNAGWWGEVATLDTTPCAQMGNGRSAEDPAAASITGILLLHNQPEDKPTRSERSIIVNGTSPERQTYYDAYKPPPPPPKKPGQLPPVVNEFRYGGNGGDCS